MIRPYVALRVGPGFRQPRCLTTCGASRMSKQPHVRFRAGCAADLPAMRAAVWKEGWEKKLVREKHFLNALYILSSHTVPAMYMMPSPRCPESWDCWAMHAYLLDSHAAIKQDCISAHPLFSKFGSSMIHKHMHCCSKSSCFHFAESTKLGAQARLFLDFTLASQCWGRFVWVSQHLLILIFKMQWSWAHIDHPCSFGTTVASPPEYLRVPSAQISTQA